MIFTAVSMVFLPLVFGAIDPTKVCAPDQVSFYSYNILTDVISFVAIDFKQNVSGILTGNISIVNDFTASKSYVTDDQGHCTFSDLAPISLYPQCLPADAVFIGDISLGIGADQISGAGWDFPYANGHARAAFTAEANKPNFPIISRFADDKGVVGASFSFNITSSIIKPDMLVIPSPCPPRVIV